MLKSYSTQFAATLFFGPLGLAYCSMAAAVFLTLVLAVLLFTSFGKLSIVFVWPLSILAGLLFVKLHNDEYRSAGGRLLLGPGGEVKDHSLFGTWGRGLAVLSLLLVGGFVSLAYLPKNGSDIGRIVASDKNSQPVVSTTRNGSADSVLVAEAGNGTLAVPDASVAPALIEAKGVDDSDDNFAVIALPEREVATVIIDNNGKVQQGEANSELNSEKPELTVNASVVNLRRGPGTNFDVITTVRGGDKLYEFARDGQWINVETVSNGFTGWIYGDLVR